MLTTVGGFRYATSIGGTLTGRGGNWIIIDDPTKAGDITSQAELERVIQFYENTLYTRLDNKNDDGIIIAMQRLHVGDLAGHVIDRKSVV